MLVRAVAGAVVGALAGLGFLLTWRTFAPPRCLPEDAGALCAGRPIAFLAFLAAWTITAAFVLAGVLLLIKRPPYWAASGSGCVLWAAMAGVSAGLVGVTGLTVLVPAFCFALTATLTTLVPSSSAHGTGGTAPE